jgi:hypothetical protein
MGKVTANFGVERLRRILHRRDAGWGQGRRSRQPRARESQSSDRAPWVGLVVVSLPGLAALVALLFTWMQVGQASKELRITEQGQITDRFNAAIGNLGSTSLDVRLGGIYALQRIMQDSVRDHPTVVSVLGAFVRQHAGASSASEKEPLAESADAHTPSADVRAAIAVLASRDPDRDGETPVDLSKADLRGLHIMERIPLQLPQVELADADLRWARGPSRGGPGQHGPSTCRPARHKPEGRCHIQRGPHRSTSHRRGPSQSRHDLHGLHHGHSVGRGNPGFLHEPSVRLPGQRRPSQRQKVAPDLPAPNRSRSATFTVVQVGLSITGMMLKGPPRTAGPFSIISRDLSTGASAPGAPASTDAVARR